MRWLNTTLLLLSATVALFIVGYYVYLHWGNKIQPLGELSSLAADETSGIAASQINAGVFYIHNDSGDTSRIFSVSADGYVIRTIDYKWQAHRYMGEHDCEDIATGPGPDADKKYIYVADIGDNEAKRPYIRIYRLTDDKAFAQPGADVKAKTKTLYFKYENGPRDAETLMVDPIDSLFYIISKRDEKVGIYTAPLLQQPGDTIVFKKRGNVSFEGIVPFKWISGGDISADGRQILIKNYRQVYYWRRRAGEPVWKTILRKPTILPYLEERMGEAIGFSSSGKSYLTVSEGVYAPVYSYPSPKR